MNTRSIAKVLGISTLALAVTVGCSSTGSTGTSSTSTPVASEPAPQPEPAQPEPTPQPEPTQQRSMSNTMDYTVVRGDNLWNIAAKGSTYGNPYAWPLIYKANKGQIDDADLIFPGQVFEIDTAASGSAMDAAVRHAKTRGAWTLGEVESSDRNYLAR